MLNQSFTSSSEEETIELGKEFATHLKKGDIVAFYGDLGTGKTEFIKGVCEQLNSNDLVTSPTFTIVNNYPCKQGVNVKHLDLYRLENKDELENIGFYEILDDESIKLIEWAEKAEAVLPEKRINVILESDSNKDDKRIISIKNNIAATAEV